MNIFELSNITVSAELEILETSEKGIHESLCTNIEKLSFVFNNVASLESFTI